MFSKKFAQFGLISRLVISVIGISFIIVTLVTFFNIQYNFISINKTLQEEEASLEARFKASFIQPVWNYDLVTLEEMIRSEFVNPLIHSLILKNNTGDIIIGFERNSNGSIDRLSHSIPTEKMRLVKIVYKRNPSNSDEMIANIYYDLNLRHLYSKMWKTIFLVSIEFIVLTIILVWSLSSIMVRRVLRPLELIRTGLVKVKKTLKKDFHFFSESTHAEAVAFPELKRMAIELEDVFKDLGMMTDKLKENQQRLELVLSGGSLGSWDWNLKTDEYILDEHWIKNLGVIIDDTTPRIGKYWSSFIHPDDFLSWKKAVADHLSGQKLFYETQFRFRFKTGPWHWILSRGKVNKRDSDGTPIRISGTHLDITDKIKAREDLDKLNILQGAILEYAGYAIVATNSNGTITTFNRAAELMLGYFHHELVHKKNLLVFHDENELTGRQKEFSEELGHHIEEGFSILVAKSLEGLPNKHEWTYIRKDGSRFPVLLSITTLRDPSNVIMGFLGVAVDISEQKKNLEAIRQKNIQLETLGVHAREMAFNAQTANEAKSKFIANMSHEIRTPMNAIIGYTDLLRETALDGEQKNFISSIQSSGELLLDLVNNILEITKIEAGLLTLKKREFSLSDLVFEVIGLILPKAQRKGIELSCTLDAGPYDKLVGDPLRLRQVMINFVENAVKFTEKGAVYLKVGPFEINDVGQIKVCFEVKDTGIGIEKNMIPKLFTRFNQLDDSITKRFGGTGLGLAISYEIIHLMGGDIKVASSLGEGTTFTFYLLLDIPTERIENVPATSLKNNLSLRPLKILLAEDTEENRVLILHYFRKLPFEFDTVLNGEEAYAKFQERTYDLILMDMQMPVMDGITATRIIREFEKKSNRQPVPIIALTAYALDEQREMCIASGCNFHVAKPIKKDDLLQIILEHTQK